MTVISIIIEDSADQTFGLPDSISVSTNTPCLIFYTLDGEIPSPDSHVYTQPIELPKYQKVVTLSILATDGSVSATAIQTYIADYSSVQNIYGGDARFPQATSDSYSVSPQATNSLFPFGSEVNYEVPVNYTGIGNPDNTLYNQAIASLANGFGADGEPTSFTNQPPDPFGAPVSNGSRNVTVIGKRTPVEFTQEASSTSDKLFNPKAIVIYQDVGREADLNPQIINRGHFSMENLETYNSGGLLHRDPLTTPTTTGSFIRSGYNPRTGKITSYYRDNAVNRWVISTWDFTPVNQDASQIYTSAVNGRGQNASKVYPWHLWARRYYP